MQLPKRPNLLLILTDQDRAIQHFPEGWAEQNLPALQRLKAHGLSFENAICNSCMCSASRSTLLTGLYPAHHQVFDTLSQNMTYSNTEVELDPDIPNLAHLFGKNGYDVHYRGKWHVSKGKMGKELTAEDIASYGFDGWTAPDAGEDVAIENFGGGRAGHDLRFANEAIQFLKSVKPDRPFCLILSLVNPHDVLAYPNSWEEDYDAEMMKGDLKLPENVGEKLDENFKPTAHNLLLQRLAIGLGPIPLKKQKLEYLNFYGNLMKETDYLIGRVLDTLYYDDGVNPPLSNATLVLRTADHGEMAMAHGGLRQKAFNAYEESIKVPLIFSNPLLFSQAHTHQSPASLIDILPTLQKLLKLKGKKVFNFQGKDLSPIIQDPGNAVDVRKDVLFTFDDVRAGQGDSEEPMPAANRLRTIRSKNWKYSRYFHATQTFPEEFEMYDLKNDPLEMQNLAHPDHPDYDKPKVAAQRARLIKRLRKLEKKYLRR